MTPTKIFPSSLLLLTLSVLLGLTGLIAPPAALAGDLEVDGSLISTVPTGTAPLEVSSTTTVTNLSSDLLDGLDSTELFTTSTDGSGSGLDADLLDGLDSTAFARALGNVVWVAQTGGDFSSIQAALDSITTASASNPFLVVVGPGVYDERVVMKPFVDIQGSGEGVTVISQAGSTDPDFGTVAGADDAELRSLTVVNSGGSDGVIGIYNSGVSPRLLHVSVRVDGSDGVNYGVLNSSETGTPTAVEMRDVTVVADGTQAVIGVLNQTEADTRMERVRVTVTGSSSDVKYGVFNSFAAPILRDVEVDASSSETNAQVYGVVNQSALEASLRSIRVEVTGGHTRYGVFSSDADFTIRDLEVRSSGSANQVYGVCNEGGAVVLEDCSIEVSGGSTVTVGVLQLDSAGEVRDCTVIAEDSSGVDRALSADDTEPGDNVDFTIDVQHSRLQGDEAALSGDSPITVRVGASQLSGGVSGSATYSCVHSYDGGFTALGSGCT